MPEIVQIVIIKEPDGKFKVTTFTKEGVLQVQRFDTKWTVMLYILDHDLTPA